MKNRLCGIVIASNGCAAELRGEAIPSYSVRTLSASAATPCALHSQGIAS